MAEFTEVTKWKKRMCSECNPQSCLLDILNNRKNMSCSRFVAEYPEEAEKIIMGWAKEHPIMTNADKFKEVFGIDKTFINCEGLSCKDANGDCDKCKYKDFWNKEYKEPEQEDL